MDGQCLSLSINRERGVVGAGVGTKLDEPPNDKWEGSLLLLSRDLSSQPLSMSSLSTLALVTVMLGLRS